MKPKDECGIAAIYALKNGMPDRDRDIAKEMPLMLQDMQNRGELSAGVTSYDKKRSYILRTFKALGTVKDAFSRKIHSAQEIESAFEGSAIIGHVRYATCGKDDVSYAQPFEREHGRLGKWFSFCFNGNVANHVELKKELEESQDYHMRLESDTEIFMHYIARELYKYEEGEVDYQAVFSELAKIFDGAWSLALLDAMGNLVVARDQYGFKPLSYAISDDKLLVASESVAIWNRGVKDIKSLAPGHMIIANEQGVKICEFAKADRHARCFFEWVYFSNVASSIDDRCVYQARLKGGEILARKETLELDDNTIVVSVPDTAKACGDSLGHELGVRVVEGLFRNRYVGRSFIQSGADRGAVIRQKFTPLPAILKGKKVILVEDSIVRGTTLKHIIKDMRERGEVEEIHLRIACPPILSPCFYGIDMSTLNELHVRNYIDVEDTNSDLSEEILDKVAKDFGADSLRFLSWQDMPEMIGFDTDELCMACVTSDYPTPHGKKLIKDARANALKGKSGRTY